MIQVETAMRAAFLAAAQATKASPAIKSAIRRKVGLVTRRTLWSVKRGKR